MKNKKLIGEILFLLLVFGVTVYMVFRGEDLHQTLAVIAQVRKLWLAPAALCVVFFIWGESIIIYYMMGTLHVRLKKWTCFLFSSIGFFYSCITPSASGGQPAQIYYMRQKDIPVPVSTLVLMVITITYKAVLVLMGLGLMAFGQGFLHTYLQQILPVFYLGIGLNVICVAILVVLVFHNSLARSIMRGGLALLERLHLLRCKESRHEKLEAGMEKYRETAAYFKTHKLVVLNVLGITFAQRLSLFLSTYFVYRAFGLQGVSAMTILLLQAAISISVDMLPLPGGMGISEKLFLTIFVPVFTGHLLLPGMILSRGLSYYTELLLSALLTLYAHFALKKETYCSTIKSRARAMCHAPESAKADTRKECLLSLPGAPA